MERYKKSFIITFTIVYSKVLKIVLELREKSLQLISLFVNSSICWHSFVTPNSIFIALLWSFIKMNKGWKIWVAQHASQLRSNKAMLCLLFQLSHYGCPNHYNILWSLLLISLFKIALKTWAKVLLCAPTLKKAMMCLTEKLHK